MSVRLKRLVRLLRVLEIERQQHAAKVAEKQAIRRELSQGHAEMIKRMSPGYDCLPIVRDAAIRQSILLERAMAAIDVEMEPLRSDLVAATVRSTCISRKVDRVRAEERAAEAARELEETIDGAVVRTTLERRRAAASGG